MIPRYAVNFNTAKLPQYKTDYLVIGSGIAGLYAAFKASKHGKVTILTKKKLEDSNTEYAQGGIAAAIDENDSPFLHLEDTLMAGAGLCDLDAVSILVNEGPDRVRELIDIGANFDKMADNMLSLTREGAHSRRRILHARGDATGEEIRMSLAKRVKQEKMVEILEDHFVVDLLTQNNRCYGALILDTVTNELKVYLGKVVIIASGGIGQLYLNTTNPDVATGDGLAFTYRAGAELMDLEFVQFHPTALYLQGVPRFLISEAVRGEGAYLRNVKGERFMPNYHMLAELAPRDIVTRSIQTEMEKYSSENVFLDVTHLDGDHIKKRFPNITATCAKYNIDLTKEFIPIAPATHYIMGGIKTDVNGATNIQGLYSCGEAACLGVHGANRLASNSLLDGLVFGERIIVNSLQYLQEAKEEEFSPNVVYQQLGEPAQFDFEKLMNEIKHIMWHKVGIIRTETELKEAIQWFDEKIAKWQRQIVDVKRLEVINALIIGRLIAESALVRTESRGSHYRLDYPSRLDDIWQKHTVFKNKLYGEI